MMFQYSRLNDVAPIPMFRRMMPGQNIKQSILKTIAWPKFTVCKKEYEHSLATS